MKRSGRRAPELLPDKLLQVQTAFLGWTNPAQTDLYDCHVYDSSGRWVHFVDDVRAAIRDLPVKPFVMGETIIGTAWTDEIAIGWWRDFTRSEAAIVQSAPSKTITIDMGQRLGGAAESLPFN